VPSRRFRRLEREGAPAPEGGGAADRDTAPEPAPDAIPRARNLEREGTLRLDEAPVDTDFCRICRCENRAGTPRCLHCDSPLGGAGQEAFDAEMRAQRESAREATASAAPALASAPEATPAPAPLGADPLRIPDPGDEPGFGTVLASGVLVACILALVSIPVRRIFDATGTQGSDGELATLVVVTLLVYASVRRRLRRL